MKKNLCVFLLIISLSFLTNNEYLLAQNPKGTLKAYITSVDEPGVEEINKNFNLFIELNDPNLNYAKYVELKGMSYESIPVWQQAFIIIKKESKLYIATTENLIEIKDNSFVAGILINRITFLNIASLTVNLLREDNSVISSLSYLLKTNN